MSTGQYSGIFCGFSNQVHAQGSVVTGGQSNHIYATAMDCFIGGGGNNNIKSNYQYDSTSSCIMGGNGNHINNAITSVIMGGTNNTINNSSLGFNPIGHNCVIGGYNALVTNAINCFVWGGDDTVQTEANSNNQFVVRASGGATFYSNSAGAGVTLSKNATSWSSISDRTKKEHLVELDYKNVLEKVDKLPIYQYNYIGTDPELLCRGPVAQDWHELFPSKKDPLRIETMDLDGISLASIKALSQEVKELRQELKLLKEKINQ